MEQNHQWLKEPSKCDNCANPRIEFINNIALYGKSIGKWPMVWHCRACRSLVSCHANSRNPMGYMAPANVRKARQRAHKCFDKLWTKRSMSRARAYEWLAQMMGMRVGECHISRFDEVQCELVVKLTKHKMSTMKCKVDIITHQRGRKVTKPGHRRRL